MWYVYAAVATGLLAGAGWLIRLYIHKSASFEVKKEEVAAARETTRRVINDQNLS